MKGLVMLFAALFVFANARELQMDEEMNEVPLEDQTEFEDAPLKDEKRSTIIRRPVS